MHFYTLKKEDSNNSLIQDNLSLLCINLSEIYRCNSESVNFFFAFFNTLASFPITYLKKFSFEFSATFIESNIAFATSLGLGALFIAL